MPTPSQPAPRKETSLDRVQLASWRLSETNGFVIKDYSAVTADQPDPVIMVIKADDIFEALADAFEQNKRISVYAIGPCLLDRS